MKKEPIEKMKNIVKNFLNNEEGIELSEYAVATALIVAGLVTAFSLLAGAIQGRLGEVQAVIDGIN